MSEYIILALVMALLASVVIAVFEYRHQRRMQEEMQEAWSKSERELAAQVKIYRGSANYWRNAWQTLRDEFKRERQRLQGVNDKLQSMLADARKEGFEPGVASLFEANESWSISDYEARELARREAEQEGSEVAREVAARMAKAPEEIQPPEEYPEP